jgi:hypothetical protein
MRSNACACGDNSFPDGDHSPRQADEDELETFSEDELQVELTIAASAPGRRRWERYQALIGEKRRRLADGHA